MARLRQQRLRQERALRPRSPASSSDPWDIGLDAVRACSRLAMSYPAARSELEQIAEAVRRLAWGPDTELEEAQA